uniref:hypothetical protein n=1 Tax=Corallococcus coralloides TaxID=184914 RepID=UPI000FFE99A3|nr:hypothetical protein [Corallococcus coralloides]
MRGERAALDAVSHLPGVLVVAEGTLPGSALRHLNETEQLFGEGLSWDAPGFQPPDGPKGRSDD